MSKRKILLVAVTSLFVFTMSELSFAMMCDDHSSTQQLAQTHSEHEHGIIEEAKEAGLLEQAVNAGNKICPVSGEKIDEKLKATYEYNGKVYNFCCASCIVEFKKDPEKYIKKIEQELQAESASQTKQGEREMEMMQESGTSHQGMH